MTIIRHDASGDVALRTLGRRVKWEGVMKGKRAACRASFLGRSWVFGEKKALALESSIVRHRCFYKWLARQPSYLLLLPFFVGLVKIVLWCCVLGHKKNVFCNQFLRGH